jgi:hypothetical protein
MNPERTARGAPTAEISNPLFTFPSESPAAFRKRTGSGEKTTMIKHGMARKRQKKATK